VPLRRIVVGFVDFLITFSILILLMAWYQYSPTGRMLARPAFTLLAFLASMGPALWITALNVKYRDFRSAGPGCQRVLRGVLLVVRHT
jgi:lipopolysaccharide transport system permease protein